MLTAALPSMLSNFSPYALLSMLSNFSPHASMQVHTEKCAGENESVQSYIAALWRMFVNWEWPPVSSHKAAIVPTVCELSHIVLLCSACFSHVSRSLKWRCWVWLIVTSQWEIPSSPDNIFLAGTQKAFHLKLVTQTNIQVQKDLWKRCKWRHLLGYGPIFLTVSHKEEGAYQLCTEALLSLGSSQMDREIVQTRIGLNGYRKAAEILRVAKNGYIAQLLQSLSSLTKVWFKGRVMEHNDRLTSLTTCFVCADNTFLICLYFLQDIKLRKLAEMNFLGFVSIK